MIPVAIRTTAIVFAADPAVSVREIIALFFSVCFVSVARIACRASARTGLRSRPPQRGGHTCLDPDRPDRPLQVRGPQHGQPRREAVPAGSRPCGCKPKAGDSTSYEKGVRTVDAVAVGSGLFGGAIQFSSRACDLALPATIAPLLNGAREEPRGGASRRLVRPCPGLPHAPRTGRSRLLPHQPSGHLANSSLGFGHKGNGFPPGPASRRGARVLASLAGAVVTDFL